MAGSTKMSALPWKVANFIRDDRDLRGMPLFYLLRHMQIGDYEFMGNIVGSQDELDRLPLLEGDFRGGKGGALCVHFDRARRILSVSPKECGREHGSKQSGQNESERAMYSHWSSIERPGKSLVTGLSWICHHSIFDIQIQIRAFVNMEFQKKKYCAGRDRGQWRN
jgi:hypothetical protein